MNDNFVTVTKSVHASAPACEIEAVSPAGTCMEISAAAARTITGLVAPYGEEGRTTGGALIFARDTIALPADLSQVKLLAGHSPEGEIIGYCLAARQDDAGLWMDFQLGSGWKADEILARAAEKLTDALSIEAIDVQRDGMHVRSCMAKAVAVVDFPAFPSARITEVHAEDQEAKKTPAARPAALPRGLAPTPAEEVHASFDEVVDILCAARSGELTPAEIHAKLTDITYSNLTSAIAPHWLGELWSGVAYKRQIIPLITNKTLKGMKATGYRWSKKPEVKEYAGDKAEVPTSDVTVEAVEITATRWASVNDIDRAFYDFNEREILAAYWRMLAESYAMVTDVKTGKWLLSQAMPSGEAKDILRAVALAGLKIADKVKEPATFALVNPLDVEKILDVKDLEAPKYLSLVQLAANPERWVLSSDITSGTVVVGTKTAAEFYELAGSPLRAEAEHLAHGGRDAGLFGYTAHSLVKPEGLLKVSLATAGAGA